MKELSLEKMENVEGGGTADCVGAALGIVGLAAAVALTPVTGGLSAWAYAGALAGGFSTGISLAGCIEL